MVVGLFALGALELVLPARAAIMSRCTLWG